MRKTKKAAQAAKTLTILGQISYAFFCPPRYSRDSSVSDSDTSSAPLVDVVKLAASLKRFADDRDWHQFHSPKNLILALTGEVGELCEIFQWMSDADSLSVAKDRPRRKRRIGGRTDVPGSPEQRARHRPQRGGDTETRLEWPELPRR